jgi:hypothetical protein
MNLRARLVAISRSTLDGLVSSIVPEERLRGFGALLAGQTKGRICRVGDGPLF